MPEAEAAFRRALSIAPDNEKARWGLGVVLAKQGRRDESVQMMLALAERSPLSPQARAAAPALQAWADERMDARAPADARRAYQLVLDAGQPRPSCFSTLGLALWQLGERRKRCAFLSRVRPSTPTLPSWRIDEGEFSSSSAGRTRPGSSSCAR